MTTDKGSFLKVGITDYVEAPAKIEQSKLGRNVELVFLDTMHPESLDEAILANLEALLVWHAHITPTLVAKLVNCKIIVRYGVGYDQIDLAALENANIVFCNTPDYGTEEVADTAVAMILGLSRMTVRYDHLARDFRDSWQENTIPAIKRLSESTVGIIGVGRIGTSVMRRMRPFGVQLMGYDPYVPSGHDKALGYTAANSLQHLLASSDIVTVHCPLSDETKGLINAEFISSMRAGSILVNTARGGLLESLDAVSDALDSNRLFGVGLDVLPEEPPAEHTMITAWRNRASQQYGRLIINPHTAYFSEQAWYEMRAKAAETIHIFFSEGRARNRIV